MVQGDLVANGETIGYQEEYSSIVEWRRKLVHIMDTIAFEAVVILLVLLYAVVVFVQLTLAGQVQIDPVHCYVANTTHPSYANDCEHSVSSTQRFLNQLDLAFLSVFVFELCFRLLGYGIAFLRDGVQFLDTFVVVLAFITALVPSTANSGGNFLNLLRIIRLLRLALIFSRLQRSRDNAAMRSKRAMYRRMGAPVEKVLTFLTEFKGRQRHKRDQDNIDWMMEVIAADELYSVAEFDEETLSAMQGAAAGGAGDMSRYLSMETGIVRRRAEDSFEIEKGEVEDEAAGVKASSADATSGAGKHRKESTADNWAAAAIATPALASKLQRLVSAEAWTFDVFELDLACQSLRGSATGKTATLVCYYLLEQHGVFNALQIDRPKMLAWLSQIDEGYARSNPYHNALHAADVVATLDYFLRQPALSRILSPIDILSALVGALVHDLAHPGFNNPFLEATKHEVGAPRDTDDCGRPPLASCRPPSPSLASWAVSWPHGPRVRHSPSSEEAHRPRHTSVPRPSLMTHPASLPCLTARGHVQRRQCAREPPRRHSVQGARAGAAVSLHRRRRGWRRRCAMAAAWRMRTRRDGDCESARARLRERARIRAHVTTRRMVSDSDFSLLGWCVRAYVPCVSTAAEDDGSRLDQVDEGRRPKGFSRDRDPAGAGHRHARALRPPHQVQVQARGRGLRQHQRVTQRAQGHAAAPDDRAACRRHL